MTPRVIAPLALRHDVSQKRSVVWSTASCMTKEVPVRYARASIVYSVSGWTRGVQVKLWDPLRTHAIPERLRGWSRQGAIQIHVIPYHTVWLLPVHAVPLQALLLNCSLSLHSSLGCWIIMTVRRYACRYRLCNIVTIGQRDVWRRPRQLIVVQCRTWTP